VEEKVESSRGSKTAKCLSRYTATERTFSPFNLDTVDGILIQWLLHYTVFAE
jgi:hypothetical protein